LAGRPAIFCGKACGTLEKSVVTAMTVKIAMPLPANAARESHACPASQISVDLAL